MVYRGTITSGVVVLPADVSLPEGTEVLVALPVQQDGSAPGPAVGQEPAELGRWAGELPTDSPPGPAGHLGACGHHPSGQDGPAEDPRDYPIADFLLPTEYAWNDDVYAAEQAVRAYLDDSHADD
jgi:hypothetical protein